MVDVFLIHCGHDGDDGHLRAVIAEENLDAYIQETCPQAQRDPSRPMFWTWQEKSGGNRGRWLRADRWSIWRSDNKDSWKKQNG
jgi:hypothetical protein